jgi:hypothetical protein
MIKLRHSIAPSNNPDPITRHHTAITSGANNPTLFTARPQSTRWCVTAISSTGETVNLGDFPMRGPALAAARIMAQACGGTAVP